MADLPNAPFDIDQVLTSTMQKVAQQADTDTKSTMNDLADALRQRVADGDTGTPAPGSTAPGWGGGGVGGWLPWLATIVVAGIAGTAVGLSGVLGVPVEQVSVLESTASVVSIAPAYACPGGPQVGQLRGGDHVVAVQRSDDSAYLGVRDPYDVADVLWLHSSDLVVDAGQPDVSALPVGACPVVAVQYGTPEPVAPVEPEPNPPAPTPDTTAPTIGTISVQEDNCYFLVTVPVSDNVGVAGVSISWSGAPNGGSRPMTPQGGGVYRLEVSGSANVYGGNYTFTVVAADGAGNTSQRVSSPTNIQCLI